MDGTVVDTEKIWREANKILVHKRGVVITPELQAEITRRIAGLAIHKSCAILKDLCNLPEPLPDIIREKSCIALELYERGITYITGFKKFFYSIKKSGLPLKVAIATNADEQTIEVTNRKLDLERFFGEHIYGISEVDFVCKPDPAIYLHTSERLQVEPELCVAIEDSAHGIAAAQAAGMFCIGINTSRNIEQVKKAHRIVDYYSELDAMRLRSSS